MNIIEFGGKKPLIHPSTFIAPGARIIGDVEIKAEASIWYNCVLRGDVHRIRIGARSNVQDGTVIHVESSKADSPDGHETIIGDDVLIGHMAMVHGCTLHDRSFVGVGAIVMNGCVIESEAMLAAGALLPPGRRIPTGELWAGRPAKYVRHLRPEELVAQREGVDHYVRLAKAHAEAIKGR